MRPAARARDPGKVQLDQLPRSSHDGARIGDDLNDAVHADAADLIADELGNSRSILGILARQLERSIEERSFRHIKLLQINKIERRVGSKHRFAYKCPKTESPQMNPQQFVV